MDIIRGMLEIQGNAFFWFSTLGLLASRTGRLQAAELTNCDDPTQNIENNQTLRSGRTSLLGRGHCCSIRMPIFYVGLA
eukprot:jgi/Botrbrau1/10798/Bobra.0064s0004.1